MIALGGMLLLTSATPGVDSRPLWGQLEPGPFEVGFRTEARRADRRDRILDSTRSLRLDIWYPAVPSGRSPLSFGDYVRAELGPAIEEDSLRAWLGTAVTGDPAGLSEETSREILASPLRARRDVEQASGRYPLVLWTPRHETTPSQAVLSEYLASRGYMVVAVRREGSRLPYPWEMDSDQQRRATLQLHVADMLEVLRVLRENESIASDHIGVLTWSYAAEMALSFQLSRPEVEMVIGLSADPFAEPGVYRTGLAAELASAPFPASYVVMTESETPDGETRQAPRVLQELAAESYFVRFRGLSHGNFNVLEGMIPGVYGLTNIQPWSTGGNAARRGYETIAQYVAGFLDHGLRRMPAGVTPPWKREEAGGPVATTRFPPARSRTLR